MTNIHSSIKSRLVFLWCSWSWLLLHCNGSPSKRSRNGATVYHNIFRRRNNQLGGRSVREKNDRKKDDMILNTNNPTNQPTLAPSDPSQYVEVRLLPFSILIHGALSLDDELEIRYELENYLLGSFQEQEEVEEYLLGPLEEQVQVTTDSIVLNMVQMVESYLPSVESDEGNDPLDQSNGVDSNRNRLLHSRRRNGSQLGRKLQSASSTSTASTLVEYQAGAILRFEHKEYEDAIEDQLPTLHQRQISALENTADVQEYFLNWFASEQLIDASTDDNTEHFIDGNENHHSWQDPVVLMAIEITGRPSILLDSKTTWKAIESILDSSATVETVDTLSDTEKDNEFDDDKVKVEDEIQRERPSSSDVVKESASTTNIKFESRESSWKVGVGVGCALLILVGFVGILLVWQKKNHEHNKKLGFFIKDKKSPSENVTSRVIEFTSDTNAGENLEIVIEEKKIENDNGMTECNTTRNSNNRDPEGYDTRNPSVPRGDEEDINNSANHRSENASISKAIGEKSSPRKSLFTFSPISFLRNPLASKNQQQEKDESKHDHENDESNSATARMNLNNVTSNDDDSMMGYSLTSLNRDREDDEGLHNNSHFDGDFDAASVESSPSNKHIIDRSIGEGNTPSIELAFSSDGTVINDLKYSGKDERSNAQPSGPVEEVYGTGLHGAIKTNSEDLMMKNAHLTDDVSDAPSDERNNGPSAVSPSRYSANLSGYKDAIRNSKLLDNDPAVVDFLMEQEEQREALKHSKRQSDHMQPQPPMEL